MLIVFEVTAPDAPRSLSLDDIRDAIVDEVAAQIEGMDLELTMWTDNGRELSFSAECSCVQELDPAAARNAGFIVSPTEV